MTNHCTIRTVGDLIALLEDYDPSTPILLGHQPSWPLAEVIAGVAGPDDRDPDPDDEDLVDGVPAVWLVAGGHPYGRSPYAPLWIFDGGAW